MKPIRLGCLAATAVCAISGCGSGSKASSSATTPPPPVATTIAVPTTVSLATVAAEYLADVAPANAGLTKIQADLDTNGNLTVARSIFSADVATFATAIQTSESKILSLPVDSATLTDIKGLISADSTVVSDLQAFAGGNGAGSIVADVGRANAAVIIVRHDLGLPLPQS